MCGISCIISKNPGRDNLNKALDAMIQAQAHRGPDGNGMQQLAWDNEEVWLGHNLLSVTGIAAFGRQPMSSIDGRCGIIFNGQIYNASYLRSQLQLEGISFSGDSDTEVLLAWVRQHGRRGLRQLEGMYAFVFWDSSRQLLIIHRDGYGIKPLFYARNRHYLVIASEPAGLFASGLFEFQPDTDAIAGYLNYRFVPGTATAWQGVHCLQPGECIEYWASKPMHYRLPRVQEFRFGGIREALDEAFQAVIPEDKPFGLALSGGIDSGLILSWCMQNNRKPEIFSIRYPEDSSGFADTHAAEKMAAVFGLEVNWVDNSEDDFFEICSCRGPGDPLVADSALVLTQKIARSARQKGLKILLSGAGADEWFGGYRRHAFFKIWLSYGRKLPEDITRRLLSGLKPGKLRWMKQDFGQANGIWQSAVSSCLQSSLQKYPVLPLMGEEEQLSENMLRWDQQHYLPGDVLWISDMAGMAEGIETRFPFLHPAITGFADGLTPVQRMGNGRKAMLRNEFRKIFGNALADRRKQGFGIADVGFLQKPAIREQLITWLEFLQNKLPSDFWYAENWQQFQQEALRNPDKFQQEWIALGRLCSWLGYFH